VERKGWAWGLALKRERDEPRSTFLETEPKGEDFRKG